MARIVVSSPARRDITDIFAWSLETFGEQASDRYRALIATAIERIGLDSNLPGSRSHPYLPDGYRVYHLRHCAEIARTTTGRVKSPRHFVVFRPVNQERIEIIRILHDRMDFQRQIQPQDEQ